METNLFFHLFRCPLYYFGYSPIKDVKVNTSLGVTAVYVDGVFSGGGIKGIALIGAIEEIEKRGYRFKRVAGASAGAIIASLIAARYTSKNGTVIRRTGYENSAG